VNKEKFLNIIQNQALIEDGDILSLQKEAKQHPYSQIIHALLAKQHNATKSTQAQAAIQLAAIYATDRVVLKAMISSAPAEATSPIVKNTTEPLETAKTTTPSISSGVTDIDQLRKDIFEHLDLLQESKKTYITEDSRLTKTSGKKTGTTKTNSKAKIVAKPKAKAASKTLTNKKGKTEKKNKSDKKTTIKPTGKTKKDSVPLSQKEQVDLIERFIKSPPNITRSKDKAPSDTDQQDLSENNASIEEDFASENLAQILTKQGNKEKAIEIYKKLIWKFPQKKAYFATQIEGLKK
jgi:hypothetical protein